jgi:hypothetical protein
MWTWISSITIKQSEPFELVKEQGLPPIITVRKTTADYLMRLFAATICRF